MKPFLKFLLPLKTQKASKFNGNLISMTGDEILRD